MHINLYENDNFNFDLSLNNDEYNVELNTADINIKVNMNAKESIKVTMQIPEYEIDAVVNIEFKEKDIKEVKNKTINNAIYINKLTVEDTNTIQNNLMNNKAVGNIISKIMGTVEGSI